MLTNHQGQTITNVMFCASTNPMLQEHGMSYEEIDLGHTISCRS